MKATVSRKAHFNAAHRLFRPDWTDQQNKDVFGKCNNPNYHGHNYDLIVSVTGHINKETGFVIDLKVLRDIIKTEIEDQFDHKNLNLDVVEFKSLNPTAENISVVIYNKIKRRLDPDLDCNQQVVGSSPSIGSKKTIHFEWFFLYIIF